MTDGWIGFDEDATLDKKLDHDTRTVGGQTVYVVKTVLVDGVANNKASVDVNGALLVRVDAAIVDTTSRGDSGSAPTAVSVTTASTVLLASSTTRRAVWFTNNGAAAVWVAPLSTHPGVGRGFLLNPGERVSFDKAPNAPWSAISTSGTVSVAVMTEDD